MAQPAVRDRAATARGRRLKVATAASALVAALAGGYAPWPCWILVAGAGVLALAAVAPRPLAGPLFFYDVIRLARRGRSTFLRVAYALGLLGVLWLIYAQRFPHHALLADPFAPGPRVAINDYARLAGSFVAAVLGLQVAAVLLLTPVYLAGAIAEERERRTLELLFTTPLTDREIVLGKLLSRLVHVGGVLLAGVPVLAVLQLWGGVDAAAVLAGVAVTAATLLSVGSLSIFWSVLSRTTLGAEVASYASLLLPTVCCPVPFLSPLAFLLELERHLGAQALRFVLFGGGAAGDLGPAWPLGMQPLTILGSAGLYCLVHAGVALAAVAAAVRGLRGRKAHARLGRPEEALALPGELPADATDARSVYRARRYPVTDNALLWKEVYHGAGAWAGWTFRQVFPPAFCLCLLLLVLVLVRALHLGQTSVLPADDPLTEFLSGALIIVRAVVRAGTIITAGAWCVRLGMRAARSITGERDRRTLAGLLTLPASTSAILGAKWAGSILRYRALGYVLAAMWAAGLVTGALHPLAALLLAVAVAAHLAFLASAGLWISLASRDSRRASLAMVLVLLLMFLGWWVGLAYSYLLFNQTQAPQGWWADFIEVGLGPAQTWWYLSLGWGDMAVALGGRGAPARTLEAVLAGIATFAALAGLFWLAALLRLRREQP